MFIAESGGVEAITPSRGCYVSRPPVNDPAVDLLSRLKSQPRFRQKIKQPWRYRSEELC